MTKASNTARPPEPSAQEIVVRKVTKAYDVAVDRASGAAQETFSTLQANPVAALVGGLALGAAVGVLVPRSGREKALLAPLGGSLAAAATAAIAAGRESGIEALKDSGLGKNALRDQVSSLVGKAAQAAGAAGSAAFTAARDKVVD